MPTIAPGTDARCMPAGIALSSAAARWSAGLDALLDPARSPPANMVVIATARRRRSVSLLFILLPPTQPVGFTPLRITAANEALQSQTSGVNIRPINVPFASRASRPFRWRVYPAASLRQDGVRLPSAPLLPLLAVGAVRCARSTRAR